MAHSSRYTLAVIGTAAVGVLLAWSPAPSVSSGPSLPVHRTLADDDGFPIRNQTVVDRCSRCHAVDDEGRMSRISYLRKSPEGWQLSIRRMMALHGARLNQEDAREIATYLANEQGLAPEEMRPGLFEVERRMADHDYEGDSDVEFTCIQCHSMGRVITQRRARDEWDLLLATHRGLYPFVDFQAFRYSGPASKEDDPRHPMDRAADHLSEAFPLETPEWSAWAATKRSPRLAGTWALSGYEPGKGAIFGTMTVDADPTNPDAFMTTASYVYAETGVRVQRSGQANVYTGYQWRGRSNPGGDSELREVMFIERDQSVMHGRWFRGDYDEIGPDITLRRSNGATVAGVYPMALAQGGSVDVRIFGAGLSSADPADLDFGAGVTVRSVRGPRDGALEVSVSVAPDADLGARDLYAFGSMVERAIVVHDGVDRVEVTPATGLARAGGAAFPKGYQTFDVIAWNDGPDGASETDDDLKLGRVPASWHLEEYTAIYDDDDVDFVGTMGQDGTFTPALDGPNANRGGNRNNIGDVWVVGTHRTPGGEELSARAHLVVTVPLYIRFDPWRAIDDGRRPIGNDR